MRTLLRAALRGRAAKMPLSPGADEIRSGPAVCCPACLHPERGERHCPVCGFPLGGDPVLGAATEEDHRAAAAELAAAAHTWDLAAARRALSDPAPRAEIAEIAGLLRPAPAGIPHVSPEGTPGTPGPVGTPAPSGTPDPAVATEPAALTDLLRGLTTGAPAELLFVQFGTQRAAVVRAFADTAGLPHARPHAETSWTELVPGLGPGDGARRFQLAGGVGTVEPVDRPAFDRAVRDWLHAVVPGACERTGTRTSVVVLLRGGTGWTLLDRAAAVLRETCATSAESAPDPTPGPGTASTATARVRRLLRGVPLREPHTLLLARAGTGAGDHVPVELHHHILFEAGLRLAPGETRTASVTVYGGPPTPPRAPEAGVPPGGSTAPSGTVPVVLPLLAGRYRPEDRHPALLGLPRTELPALGSAHLTFVLRGPGEIEVRADAGDTLAEARAERRQSLHAVVHGVPRFLPRPRPLELICAVEMSGADRSEVAERVGFTSDLIRAAERHSGAGGGLRVAVIGYYHHAPRNEHQRDRDLITYVRPGPPDRAQRQLRELSPEIRPRDTLTSSLEDALGTAAKLAAGPRAERAERVDRVLLVVGSRPPALPAQDGLVPGCPRAVDWREQLGTLRHRGVRVGVRAEPFAAPATPGVPSGDRLRRYLARTWQDLTGTDRLLFRPGTDSAERAALAFTAGQERDSDGCPLAFAAPPLPPRPSDLPRS
ncbi:hypothetical protein ABTZ59_30735 [Streptomyces sp. NPDC094034]|uniref:hypothetical protein n=1 Tax=Streptomyces sp. NPDC094034 TaxID=3155309 RepID=UPI003330179A